MTTSSLKLGFAKKPNQSSNRAGEVRNSIRIFFSFVNDHVVEEGDPLDVRFLLNEKVLDSFDNWCIRYQKTAGTLRNHFNYFSKTNSHPKINSQNSTNSHSKSSSLLHKQSSKKKQPSKIKQPMYKQPLIFTQTAIQK
jgi:hypothetical protein